MSLSLLYMNKMIVIHMTNTYNAMNKHHALLTSKREKYHALLERKRNKDNIIS